MQATCLRVQRYDFYRPLAKKTEKLWNKGLITIRNGKSDPCSLFVNYCLCKNMQARSAVLFDELIELL